MAHEMLETRTMTEMVRMFDLGDLFGLSRLAPIVEINSQVAEWQELNYSRRLSALYNKNSPGGEVAREQITYRTATMLNSREHTPIEGIDMNTLMRPGQSDTSVRYGEQLVTDGLKNLTNQVRRRMEQVCMTIFQGGQASLYIEGSTQTVGEAFTTSPDHTPTVAAAWSSSNTDILTDVATYKQRVKQDSGLPPDFILFDESVHGWLLNNTVLREFLRETNDVNNIVREGRILRLMGLDVHVYDEVYTDAAGNITAIWPVNFALMGCYPAKSMAKTLVGVPPDVESNGSPGIFSKSHEVWNPSGVEVLVHAAFLTVLPIKDAFLYIDLVP